MDVSSVSAGTVGEGVLRSVDGGATWLFPQSGFIRRSLGGSQNVGYITCLAAVDMRILAGTTDYGIFVSDDSGSTWSQARPGLRETQRFRSFAVSGIRIFAGTNGKGVFVSLDKGDSWVPVDSGLPVDNVQVATGDSALFSGT